MQIEFNDNMFMNYILAYSNQNNTLKLKIVIIYCFVSFNFYVLYMFLIILILLVCLNNFKQKKHLYCSYS